MAGRLQARAGIIGYLAGEPMESCDSLARSPGFLSLTALMHFNLARYSSTMSCWRADVFLKAENKFLSF